MACCINERPRVIYIGVESMEYSAKSEKRIELPRIMFVLTKLPHAPRMESGATMRWLRKTAMTALVWATASSMLFAATPYYVCRCPDGTIKPHCTSTTSAKSSCCQTGCCSQEGKKKPCCPTPKKTAAKKPDVHHSPTNQADTPKNYSGGPSFDSVNCQRILVQSTDRVIGCVEIKPTYDMSGFVADLPSISNSVPVVTNAAVMHWRPDKIPPPTDLISLFQRITI